MKTPTLHLFIASVLVILTAASARSQLGSVALNAAAVRAPAASADGGPTTDVSSGLRRGHPEGLPYFRDAVRAIGPSVVNISSARQVQTRSRGPSLLFRGPGLVPHGHPFERFFSFPETPGQMEQESLGSGVVMSGEGHILTNNHVVDGADRIRVTLADGRAFDAEVVGTDPPTDLAVLKIDADDLVPAELADSDAMEVGDWVLAVGSPFGLDHTVTSGIVSAKGRAGVGVSKYEDFIQTDAAINPGNSGGPLVDLDGRVVGINTAIASRTGGYMGIGFAIPSSIASNVMGNLIDHGSVDRGYLGVYIQDLDTELAESFGFEGEDGVLVTQVIEDGPADRAGIREGDIVTRIDGRVMTSANGLATTIATLANGVEVEVEIFRGGEHERFLAVIGRDGAPDGGRADGGLGLLDLSATAVTPELVARHGLSVAEGAFVTEVEPGGLAARLGIRPGDVILAVGDARIVSAEDLDEALASGSLEQGIRLLVDSGGRRRFVLVRQQR